MQELQLRHNVLLYVLGVDLMYYKDDREMRPLTCVEFFVAYTPACVCVEFDRIHLQAYMHDSSWMAAPFETTSTISYLLSL